MVRCNTHGKTLKFTMEFDMDLLNNFIIYLILYRLSIIFTGLISVYLGYKLFLKGVFAAEESLSVSGVDIETKVAGNSFNIKNAAPGTVFALFGAAIVVVMAWNGSPELVKKELESLESDLTEITLRSGSIDNTALDSIIQKKLQGHIVNGGTLSFLYSQSRYEEALLSISNNLNGLAWEYKEKGDLENALPIAKLAVSINPKEPNFLDTLAEIYFDLNEYELAVKYMSKVVIYDNSQKDKLEKYSSHLSED